MKKAAYVLAALSLAISSFSLAAGGLSLFAQSEPGSSSSSLELLRVRCEGDMRLIQHQLDLYGAISLNDLYAESISDATFNPFDMEWCTAHCDDGLCSWKVKHWGNTIRWGYR